MEYLGPVFPPQINLPLTLMGDYFAVKKPALSLFLFCTLPVKQSAH